MAKERKCLACGRPLTGRQRKWCSNDDCEGYYALHPEEKIEYIEKQKRLQKIQFAQERVDELRDKAGKYVDDERMRVRFENYITDAELELGILNGTIEPFCVTCSVCDNRIGTSLLEHPDYEDPKWVCKDCKSQWFHDYQESVVKDFGNWIIRHDILGNLLYERKKESTKIREADTEAQLAKMGIKIKNDLSIMIDEEQAKRFFDLEEDEE